MAHFADITDSGQYIPQEAFPKVSRELETAQKDLSTNYWYVRNGKQALSGRTWQLPQSTASLKSSQIVATQFSTTPAWTPGSDTRGARAASRIACFMLTSWENDNS